MGLTRAVRYRVQQFLRALTAQQAISKERIDRAAGILSNESRALFARQAPQDQRHALDVYDALLEEGYINRDLLTAALLHDVGKAAAKVPSWQRGIFVLAERFAPDALSRLVKDDIGEREGPLVSYARHAEIGARWAEEAGCSALTVELIRHHECRSDTSQTERDRLLRALQAADGLN